MIHTREQRSNLSEENIRPKHSSSTTIKLKNQQNIFLLKLLSNEQLFNGYLEDLIDIYQLTLTTTIECIAIINEENSMEKYLFIKLSNGNIDKYQMNKTKSLWKMNQQIFEWKNDGKHPEYYRRFSPETKTNEIISTDQLMEIKSKRKYLTTTSVVVFLSSVSIFRNINLFCRSSEIE